MFLTEEEQKIIEESKYDGSWGDQDPTYDVEKLIELLEKKGRESDDKV